jgi:hypothetical protein
MSQQTKIGFDLIPWDGAFAGALHFCSSSVDGPQVREILCRLDEIVQLVYIDDSGHSAATPGEKYGIVLHPS